ncbi:arsenate reductase ArsC [Ralstonia pseudosolanacearum]|uniref:arsenate reductase ArsC n=1 Tax=Ralstonia pseudosolanacearum TaxID=1310165 RepID=UPI001FFD51EF|nr:arsenate reductase ArsC [Ralstonia pseudosolanacearum]
MDHLGFQVDGYRSKSWDDFVADGSPLMHIVITTCDSAAAEQCPYWGGPVKMHWGYTDPSNAPGGDQGKCQAFEVARQAIGYRVLQLLALPLDMLTNAELQAELERISRD